MGEGEVGGSRYTGKNDGAVTFEQGGGGDL